MIRLIQKGLMFGNLIPVTSPALVERYNRALEQFLGKRTALPDFHVDISGFSPEIADELDDWQYLNPNGCNRQFILLTTEQKTAPLLDAQFSMSRSILRQFIEANEAQLFALTAKDAVMGELENSVFEVSSPPRLNDIHRITVQADTTRGHVANADALHQRIERFRREPDAWWDDVLIAEMIGLAQQTGDITRNPIRLQHPAFTQDTFWTAHFGGIYLFRNMPLPAAISAAPKETLSQAPLEPTLDLADRNGIARFLERNELVEPIVTARGADAVAILRQKMDFILVDAAAQLGQDVPGRDRRDLRRLARDLGSALPVEFHALSDLVRWAEGGGAWPRIASDHPAYFYTLRARPHPDRDIVNQLLSELSRKDVRQLFICHKPLFYRLYKDWAEEKKSFVADFLEAEYQMDKAGARAALFGPAEPEMEEPPVPDRGPWGGRDQDALIDLVGPWGPVRNRG